MSDRSLTPVSGPGDLGLALAQPESRAVSTAEQAQIFDQVATATAAVLSDVVTSPLQTPSSICSQSRAECVWHWNYGLSWRRRCWRYGIVWRRDVIDSVLDSADGYRDYYDSTYD